MDSVWFFDRAVLDWHMGQCFISSGRGTRFSSNLHTCSLLDPSFLSLSLFSFSLQFSPLVAANISPLGLVLARQPLAAIEAAMMGRQRSRKQRRSQLRSSSLIDLVRVFFSIFGRCCRVTCEGGSLSFIIFFGSRGRTSFFFSRGLSKLVSLLCKEKKTRKRSSVVEKNTGEWMEKSARPERGTVTLIESRSHVW